MPQASDSTAWIDRCYLPGPGLSVMLVSALALAIALVLILALAAMVRHGLNRQSPRRAHLAALVGSSAGFTLMSGGFVLYLSSSGWANGERVELYGAVLTGALVFTVCAMALCKLRGALSTKTVGRPGHDLVNLFAILLCGWLGYGFVTAEVQPFGLAALLATGVLACAMGVHLTTSREYSCRHVFATGKQGLQACIEWRDDEQPAWVLRDITPDNVRAAAYRHRRDWHKGNSRNGNRRATGHARVCVRRRLTRFTTGCRS